jgi:hypothetical protein
MRVIFGVGSYNSRRYGKPWLAVITDWPIGKHPTLEFGASLDWRTAEIDAKPGQIVRFGQKDHRGNGTTAEWGIVQRDGVILESNPTDCREHWLKGCPVPPVETDGDNVVPFRAQEQ